MTTSLSTLHGKVALVTGAAQGIGRATALAYAQAGASVLVTDLAIEENRGKTVATEIQAAGGRAHFVTCDVTNEIDIKRAVDAALDRFGRLDIACNNAGYQCPPKLTADTEREDWDRVIGVNLLGVWLCMKHELRQMMKQGDGGAIVNISSLAGLVGVHRASSYAASKHGVIGLTKSAAIEYAPYKIRVNAVCPALVLTEMARRFIGDDPQLLDQIQGMSPLGRTGTPEEIASAVIWLSSPGAGFTTGHALSVDGGGAAA